SDCMMYSLIVILFFCFFFSSRRRHTRSDRDWSSDVCSSDLKTPAIGKVCVRRMNLEGDRQADLTVHGGLDKAIYAYPSEHYGFWKDVYPWLDMPWGMLGENITTEGMDEHVVNIGDQFRFGSSILMVTQPRLPCQKLARKFGVADVGKRMTAASGLDFICQSPGRVK